jgi:hypothetical protein
MVKKLKFSRRKIAAALTFSFLLSSLAQGASLDANHAVSVTANGTTPLQRLIQNPSLLQAPVEFYTLRELYHGDKGALIIHVQDAHANLSGQENLARTLDLLMKKYGVSLVLVEGGSVDGTLDPLKKLVSPAVCKRIAKSLLVEGKLHGEEYLNLTSDHPMKIQGVEDMDLYFKSVRAYEKLAQKRQEAVDYLKKIQYSLQKIKNKLYPDDILAYEKARRESGVLSAEFKKLLVLARKSKIHLKDYPQILKVIRRAPLADILMPQLMDELDSVESAIYRRRLTAPDSRLVYSIDRYLALLFKAYQIQMTSDEFREFEASEPDFSTTSYLAFINRKLAELTYFEDLVSYQNILEKAKIPLKEFYQSVYDRDQAFMKNAENALMRENQSIAVLITGGYHTQNLSKLMRERGYSYAVLTPTITSQTNQEKYERLLLEPLRLGRERNSVSESGSPKGLLKPHPESSSDVRPVEAVLGDTPREFVARTGMPSADPTAVETLEIFEHRRRVGYLPGRGARLSVDIPDMVNALSFLTRTLLTDIQNDPKGFNKIFGQIVKQPVTAIQFKSLNYFRSGEHKDVFKVEFYITLASGEKREVITALAMKKAISSGYIRKDEIRFNQINDETTEHDGSIVPVFFKAYYFDNDPKSEIEGYFEEFIQGKEIMEVIVDGPEDLKQKSILGAAKALIKAYDITGGQVPTDIHHENFMVRDSDENTVIVDPGYIIPQEFSHLLSRIIYSFYRIRSPDTGKVGVADLEPLLDLVKQRPQGDQELERTLAYLKKRLLLKDENNNPVLQRWEHPRFERSEIKALQELLDRSYIDPIDGRERKPAFDTMIGRAVQPVYLDSEAIYYLLEREVVEGIIKQITEYLKKAQLNRGSPSAAQLGQLLKFDDWVEKLKATPTISPGAIKQLKTRIENEKLLVEKFRFKAVQDDPFVFFEQIEDSLTKIYLGAEISSKTGTGPRADQLLGVDAAMLDVPLTTITRVANDAGLNGSEVADLLKKEIKDKFADGVESPPASYGAEFGPRILLANVPPAWLQANLRSKIDRILNKVVMEYSSYIKGTDPLEKAQKQAQFEKSMKSIEFFASHNFAYLDALTDDFSQKNIDDLEKEVKNLRQKAEDLKKEAQIDDPFAPPNVPKKNEYLIKFNDYLRKNREFHSKAARYYLAKSKTDPSVRELASAHLRSFILDLYQKLNERIIAAQNLQQEKNKELAKKIREALGIHNHIHILDDASIQIIEKYLIDVGRQDLRADWYSEFRNGRLFKTIPILNYNSGKIARPLHRWDAIRNKDPQLDRGGFGGKLDKALEFLQMGNDPNNSIRYLEAFKKAYFEYRIFFYEAVLLSWQNARLEQYGSLLKINEIVDSDNQGLLEKLRERLGKINQIVSYDEALVARIEKLVEMVDPGFQMFKREAGDEIGIRFKDFFAFIELNDGNAAQEYILPDEKDSWFHEVLLGLYQRAKEIYHFEPDAKKALLKFLDDTDSIIQAVTAKYYPAVYFHQKKKVKNESINETERLLVWSMDSLAKYPLFALSPKTLEVFKKIERQSDWIKDESSPAAAVEKEKRLDYFEKNLFKKQVTVTAARTYDFEPPDPLDAYAIWFALDKANSIQKNLGFANEIMSLQEVLKQQSGARLAQVPAEEEPGRFESEYEPLVAGGARLALEQKATFFDIPMDFKMRSVEPFEPERVETVLEELEIAREAKQKVGPFLLQNLYRISQSPVETDKILNQKIKNELFTWIKEIRDLRATAVILTGLTKPTAGKYAGTFDSWIGIVEEAHGLTRQQVKNLINLAKTMVYEKVSEDFPLSRAPPDYVTQLTERNIYGQMPKEDIDSYLKRLKTIDVVEFKKWTTEELHKISNGKGEIAGLFPYGSYLWGFRNIPTDIDLIALVKLDAADEPLLQRKSKAPLYDIPESLFNNLEYARSTKDADLTFVTANQLRSDKYPQDVTKIINAAIALRGEGLMDFPVSFSSDLNRLVWAHQLISEGSRARLRTTMTKRFNGSESIAVWRGKALRRFQEAALLISKIDPSVTIPISFIKELHEKMRDYLYETKFTHNQISEELKPLEDGVKTAYVYARASLVWRHLLEIKSQTGARLAEALPQAWVGAGQLSVLRDPEHEILEELAAFVEKQKDLPFQIHLPEEDRKILVSLAPSAGGREIVFSGLDDQERSLEIHREFVPEQRLSEAKKRIEDRRSEALKAHLEQKIKETQPFQTVETVMWLDRIERLSQKVSLALGSKIDTTIPVALIYRVSDHFEKFPEEIRQRFEQQKVLFAQTNPNVYFQFVNDKDEIINDAVYVSDELPQVPDLRKVVVGAVTRQNMEYARKTGAALTPMGVLDALVPGEISKLPLFENLSVMVFASALGRLGLLENGNFEQTPPDELYQLLKELVNPAHKYQVDFSTLKLMKKPWAGDWDQNIRQLRAAALWPRMAEWAQALEILSRSLGAVETMA